VTIATAAFARKRADDIYFPAMALLLLAFAVAGFGPSYFFAGMMAAPLPSPLVHVHAAVLTAWIALQALQPLLVAAGRSDWHRTAGVAGMAFAVAVPALGVLAVIGEIRRHAHGVDDLALTLAFVLAAAIDFGVLVFLGLRQRTRDLSAHKRFMLLATISILGPVIGRFPFLTSITAYYAIFGFFAALVIAFDLLSLGRIHRATILGVAIIAASQALAEGFWRTSAAHDLVAWIQSV
jgi:hypothetical protein